MKTRLSITVMYILIATLLTAQNHNFYFSSEISPSINFQLKDQSNSTVNTKNMNSLILNGGYKLPIGVLIELGLGVSHESYDNEGVSLQSRYVDLYPVLKIGYVDSISNMLKFYVLGSYSYLIGNGRIESNGSSYNTNSEAQIAGLSFLLNARIYKSLGVYFGLGTYYENYSNYRQITTASNIPQKNARITPQFGVTINF